MTKKKKVPEKEEVIPEAPASPDTSTDEPQSAAFEPENLGENAAKEPSDLVKCRVVTGSIIFEQGRLERGSVFTVTRERAALFEKNDVEILG